MNNPRGWKAAVASVLWIAVAVLVLAGIWQGDWRWYATAAVVAVPATVFLGMALPPSPAEKKDTAKWN